MKEGAHGAFIPGRMKLPQATWIEAFLEGVTDKSTELTMRSLSACEHCWSIEGWIHSKRRNRLSQELVETLLRTHTNLVMRESWDTVLHLLLPWDIEFAIDDPEQEPEVYEKV